MLVECDLLDILTKALLTVPYSTWLLRIDCLDQIAQALKE